MKGRSSKGSKTGVVRHRAKITAQGSRRVEATVAGGDVGLINAVAGTLRAGGKDAERMREVLAPLTSIEPVRTGTELVAFFRASLLVAEELTIGRDQSTGRWIDLEFWHSCSIKKWSAKRSNRAPASVVTSTRPTMVTATRPMGWPGTVVAGRGA